MLDPTLNLVHPGKQPAAFAPNTQSSVGQNTCFFYIYFRKYFSICFINHGQLYSTSTLGSPIRDIATLRRRFMPPLYCDTKVSAIPPSNIRNTFRDCSAAWWKEIESFEPLKKHGLPFKSHSSAPASNSTEKKNMD